MILPSALPYMYVFILTKSKYISQILNSKLWDITLPMKVSIVKTMVFPVVVYRCELNHKKAWTPKNWFQTVVVEKTLESPLATEQQQTLGSYISFSCGFMLSQAPAKE